MSRSLAPRESHLVPVTNWLARLPYWLLAMILLGIIFLWIMLTNELHGHPEGGG